MKCPQCNSCTVDVLDDGKRYKVCSLCLKVFLPLARKNTVIDVGEILELELKSKILGMINLRIVE